MKINVLVQWLMNTNGFKMKIENECLRKLVVMFNFMLNNGYVLFYVN